MKNRVARVLRPAARAFTLLEVLVAIAAIALISVGLAKIFGATSETLRGGRRLSHFNDYARMLERTMREDFKRMTRRGFLVIAHEETENPVERFRGDRSPRNRRIDQILFFTNGRFQTQRAPLHPTRVASGSEAMIYYGHGLRQEPGGTRAIPALDDLNRDGTATDSGAPTDAAPWFGEPGPNEFASDWILLRHLAVLAEAKLTPPPRPTTLTFPSADQWADNPLQVELAPAQSSLFRNMARGTPGTLPNTNQIARPYDGGVARPMLSSGIVDLIATNLSQVRSIILDAQPIANNNPAVTFDPNWADNDAGADEDYDGNGTADGPAIAYAFKPDLSPGGNQACGAMKQWMLQALPGEPRTRVGNGPLPFPSESDEFGGRMRCELVPPDYLGTQANNGGVYVRDEEYRRTDQIMLAASNFAPACTELIIEWSYGESYIGGTTPDPFLTGSDDPRANQIIWHGLPRFAETDYDNGNALTQNDRIAGPYYGKVGVGAPAGVPANVPIDGHQQLVRLTDGRTGIWQVNARVVHEPVDNQGLPDPQPGEPFYSTFGYVDPTFAGPTANSPASPDTIPCAWPRLIRVTMTLADPADPGFEQIYQFILEVPDDDDADSAG